MRSAHGAGAERSKSQPIAPHLADKLRRLESILETMESVVIAFSGGVDSTLLLRVAVETPKLRHLAVTTESPTTPAAETAAARTLARALGAAHMVVLVDELDTPGYADNTPDRCYLCKQTLFPLCMREAAHRGFRWVVDGANVDDLRDYRPGLRAAAELGVRHPLVEAGLGKADIRSLSAWFALPTSDKPASPCLASRFPYGTRITHDGLARVARAESALHALGFRELRVRFLGTGARVEIGAEQHRRLVDPRLRHEITVRVLTAGFERVEIAAEPLRSGSLNDVLQRPSRPPSVARPEDPKDE